MFFNILSSFAFITWFTSTITESFSSKATNCVTNESWYCSLSKYTRQLMFYIKPLYMSTCSKTKLFSLFWPGFKKCCYKYLQHLLLLDEHSYKLKKGILWSDHIKHDKCQRLLAVLFFFLKYSTENAHRTLII